jgi:hypothetical protein
VETPRTSLRAPSRAPWIVLGIAVVIAAAGLWFWLSRSEPAPAVTGVESPAQPTATATPAGPDVDPATARALLDAVSSNDLIRRGTSQEDVVRRWAIVTDNLAEGVSPRRQLQFLAPHGKFSVVAAGGKTVIAPESYARYDAFADAVASLDVGAVVKAYRGMYGMVERAYQALGYPGSSLDRVTARALQRLVAAPIPKGDVEVTDEGGGVYRFADPKLEALGGAEKHLLRMGPRNAAMVQDKAREILAALGVSPA